MKIDEKSREAIQQRAGTMSDFLKLEYLEGCLKRTDIDLEAKKHCHAELSRIYADKKMFGTAARHASIAAELAYTYKEKLEYYTKEAELRILAEDYEIADKAIQHATRDIGAAERFELNKKFTHIYKKQAEHLESLNQNNKAIKIYEKLIPSSDEAEKIELRNKLISLYEKTGKIREFMALKGK